MIAPIKPRRRAVILGGSRETGLCPLANCLPRLAFPLANRPMLYHQMAFLRRHGVHEVGVSCASERQHEIGSLEGVVQELSLPVHWFVDDGLVGSGGCLRPLRGFTGDEDFLVLQGGLLLEHLDLGRLWERHRMSRSVATMVITPRGAEPDPDDVELAGDEQFRAVHSIDEYGRQSRHQFGGVCLFSSRVFDFLGDDPEAYLDLRQQLLPALLEGGEAVHLYRHGQRILSVDRPESYMNAHRALLLSGNGTLTAAVARLRRIQPEVWAAPGARVDRTATVLGPVVLGAGSEIEADAKVIGPASLGDGARVGAGAVVRDSVVWAGVHIEPGAHVRYCIVTDRARIPAHHAADRQVVLRSDVATTQSRAMNLLATFEPARHDPVVIRTPRRLRQVNGGARGWLYRRAKRGLDLFGALAGLVLFGPAMLCIAWVIKRDSDGPALFAQTRIGSRGRPFRMLKFRTMVNDAERQQAQLREHNETDGPMFKLSSDPRVTRVGHWLRRTSVDELPQFVNVLRGEMSLVGPRPLSARESRCASRWRDLRGRVKPGMTGLWQVNGRSDGRFRDWIREDLAYVRRRSLWLDLWILWRTVTAVLTRRGAM